MEDNPQNENIRKDLYKEEKSDEDYFTNVFSHIGKFEKNKRYQQMQNGLNSLSQNIRLLEEFSSKDDKDDKLSNKRKFFARKINMLNFDKDNGHKRSSTRNRNSVIFKKKVNIVRSDSTLSNNINISDTENYNYNYYDGINRNVYDNINKKNKSSKKKPKRIDNLSLQKYDLKKKMIYKTEVNNYNQLINGQKLPNIFLSSDKVSESNLGSKNSNSNSTSRLPLIYDRSQTLNKQKMYLFTDNDIDNNTSINDIKRSRNVLYKKIPLIRKNLKDNSMVKKYPSIINSHRLNSYSLNHKQLPEKTDKIARRMKEKNIKIKNRINRKINEQDLIDWEMKSRFKLVQWKYGIAEVQKYFIDMQAFGKPEEEELLKRKTFYDYVEDLIDDIKKIKEEKYIKSIEDKYTSNKEENKFGKVKKKEEKNEDITNELNAVDNTVNKQVELCEILKKVELRKKKEKASRCKIDNILFRSDMRRKAINDSTNKIIHKKQKLNNSTESYKNDKTNTSNENTKNDNTKEEISNAK